MEGPGVFVSGSRESSRGETEEVIMGTASSSTMEADCKQVPEYVTAFEHRRAYWLWLEQERKRCTSEEEFLTAVANPTWTEVAPLTSNLAEGSTSSSMSPDDQRMIQVMNQQFFQELIKKERTPGERNDSVLDYAELDTLLQRSAFFMDFGGRLALGKKIAQGGQAEIYEALFDGKKAVIHNDFLQYEDLLMQFNDKEENSLVLKVFQLEQSEWFRGAWADESKNIYMQNPGLRESGICCFVMNCTLLKDGRFAFLMRRYWGDLRKAINIQIVKDKTHLKPPFPPSISTHIMYQIAWGMELLHREGTLHKDLKAANVLVREDIETSVLENGLTREVVCEVADFESVVRVMGTGFWRAPEVLCIMRSRAQDKYTDPMIWTEKVDVYSFAMTCYEVLTGCIPFQSRRANDYNIGEERPLLPDYVDEEIQDLLRRCWDSEPSKRPSFNNILDEVRKFGEKKREYFESIAEDKRDADAKEWVRSW